MAWDEEWATPKHGMGHGLGQGWAGGLENGNTSDAVEAMVDS